MHGPITLAGYTFTADEWSKVEADLRDVHHVVNDQALNADDLANAAPMPVNDNGDR